MMIKNKPMSGEIAERKTIEIATTPGDIIKIVAKVFRTDEEEIKQKRKRGNTARATAIYIAQRYSGLKNEDIGEIFGGLHYSAVTKASGRLREKMRNDRKLRKQVEEVISHVKT